MDSKLILEAARGTLAGTLSFPEIVGKLLAAGVVQAACAPSQNGLLAERPQRHKVSRFRIS
jgi:hypothetical protein